MSQNAFEYVERIATELNLPRRSVHKVLELLDEGATIPFIARYRKEASGSLDEIQIAAIRDSQMRVQELEKRRDSILSSLVERNLLSDQLLARIRSAQNQSELEDIYLPFRPKRKTRASAAKERGLEQLALELFKVSAADPLARAADFVNEEKSVNSAEEALAGARDIVAEWISENAECRKELRLLWNKSSVIESKVVKAKADPDSKYKDYFQWSEPSNKIPSHRLLAIFRGENEGVLRVALAPDESQALECLKRRFVTAKGKAAEQIMLAAEDSYKRLIAPSLETEFRAELKAKADQEAIRVFVSNLRDLLMAPPLGEKAVMAIDPGFRTGCKIACLNKQGDLLAHDVIYPHNSDESGKNSDSRIKASSKLIELCRRFAVEAIAIGNGTAGRETEEFVRNTDYKTHGLNTPALVMVNESGASIYSASEVARDEFPDHDITVRGAVSIGRRLMDPLAELVKLDPKSIGVGQYQHDVDQNALQTGLNDTVVSCVNSVGVELNTCSKELLSFVSGLNKQLAQNIVKFRQENGPFKTREQLKKVSRLGPKAFEQCAGFLRIRNADNPLDASAVHPERYALVSRMASDLKCKVEDLMRNQDLRKRIDLKRYVDETVGLPTLQDILAELEKPGRDPRPKLEPMRFADGVHCIEDLREGMKLPGIVTNVTDFGAFVDIGVHQDGLVHISELANRFVKSPSEVVKVQQQVTVTVLSVDEKRKRISLSLKRP